MGKYLDALNDAEFEPLNLSFTPKENYIDDAISTAKNETNDLFGQGVVLTLWITLLIYVSKQENQFNLSFVQSATSVTVVVLSISLILLLIGLLGSVKVFVWTMLVVLLLYVLTMFRSS